MSTLRPVSAQVVTDLARRITKPGFLIRLGFPQVQFISTRGSITWLGAYFEEANVEVSGFDVSVGAGATRGSLVIHDCGDVLANLIVNVGAAERQVTIWQIASDAPGDDDAVLYFDGIIDDVNFDVRSGRVGISCVSPMTTLFAPRFYVSEETGFHHVPQDGTVIMWGDTRVVLSRQGT